MDLNNLLFSNDHIWLKSVGNNEYEIGITDYAQDLLGDIVFFEINENQITKKGEPFGFIESVKTSSDLIAPAELEIVSINTELMEELTLINDKPYENHLCKIKVKSEEKYLNEAEYKTLLG